MCMRDRGERGRGLVVKEKKLARRDRLPRSKFTKHMKFWFPMSIFRFRDALDYLGMRMRPTFWQEIDKQEAETKKKIKEVQKACVKCGIRHKKARSRKLFLTEGWAVRNFQN